MTLPAHRYLTRAKAKKDKGPRNFAFDLDGTADAFPLDFECLISALTAAGHNVYILTGVSSDEVPPGVKESKIAYLKSIGIGPELYRDLIVCAHPHAETKIAAMEDYNIGVIFENNKGNCKAAVKAGFVALLLYNSKES